MDNKDIMYNYIKKIQECGLLTEFIAYLFDYKNFFDYNYIFRLGSDTESIIIDIYDNISHNRFNRYIFSFSKGPYDYRTKEIDNVYVTKIYLPNLEKENTKLLKLAILFKQEKNNIITYAKTFLPDKYLKILMEALKKPNHF